MIKVTVQDLLKFVKSQDPNKIINMDENYYDNECGCLMVQYGKDKFPDKFNGCGTSVWFANYAGIIPLAGIAAGTAIVITLIVVLAKKRKY